MIWCTYNDLVYIVKRFPLWMNTSVDCFVLSDGWSHLSQCRLPMTSWASCITLLSLAPARYLPCDWSHLGLIRPTELNLDTTDHKLKSSKSPFRIFFSCSVANMDLQWWPTLKKKKCVHIISPRLTETAWYHCWHCPCYENQSLALIWISRFQLSLL